MKYSLKIYTLANALSSVGVGLLISNWIDVNELIAVGIILVFGAIGGYYWHYKNVREIYQKDAQKK